MLFWDLKLSSRTWCTPSQGRNPAPMTRISAYSRRWFAASKMQIIISMLGEKNAAPWGSQHSIPSERQHGMRGFKCWNALQFYSFILNNWWRGHRGGRGRKKMNHSWTVRMLSVNLILSAAEVQHRGTVWLMKRPIRTMRSTLGCPSASYQMPLSLSDCTCWYIPIIWSLKTRKRRKKRKGP